LNKRQAARLRRLSDFLAARDRSRFMFELLVPAEKAQLERLDGEAKIYDRELRPRLMVEAIGRLQEAGVDPDLWKIEGLDSREDCRNIVAAARAGGRDKVGCILLGRGEDGGKVREWLTVAAGVPGFVGFAIGRTAFWKPLVAWLANRVTREHAVAEIAARFAGFADLFEKNGSRPSPAMPVRAGSSNRSFKED
jgi:5-dehydro-2-deoxygluconokinase